MMKNILRFRRLYLCVVLVALPWSVKAGVVMAADIDPPVAVEDGEESVQQVDQDATAYDAGINHKEQGHKEQGHEEQGPGEQGPEWEPLAVEYDWIQLTSGEWLKGEFKSMYHESVEFDSDKLDLLTIDWEDVVFLKTHHDSQINIEGTEPVTGRLKVSGSTVTITRNSYSQIFNRDELISLTPTGAREADLWSIKYTLALNFKAGNTDQIDYTAKLNARRRTAKTRFIFDYVGNISKTGDEDGNLIETVNSHRINSNFDVFSTRYFFYTPLAVEMFRDPFQNISRRSTYTIGVGYTIVDTDATEWRVGGGPAYIATRYFSVEPGVENKADSAALALYMNFDTELTSTVDYIFKYNMQLSDSDAGSYNHHMVSTFENEITGRLDFDISLYWDRITHPVKDDQGVQPEEDDFRLALGVTFTY